MTDVPNSDLAELLTTATGTMMNTIFVKNQVMFVKLFLESAEMITVKRMSSTKNGWAKNPEP